MKEIIIKVEGMVCNGCENRVINALKLVNGVQEVKASFQEGTVSIEMSENVSLETLEEKIENIGFTVVKD